MNKYLLNKETILHSMSLCALVMLFAGSFIYNSLIGLYNIPSYLGGYFTIVSIILFLIYIILISVKGVFPRNGLIIISGMVFWFIFVSLEYVLSTSYLRLDIYLWSITQILANIICFFIALNLKLSNKNIRYLIMILIIFSLIVFSNIFDGRFDLRSQSENDRVATYQIFGLSILVISFIVFAHLRTNFSKFFCFIISILLLYFNGSRSEFVFYIISVVTLFVLIEGKGEKRGYYLLFLPVIFFLGFLGLNYVGSLSGNRVTELMNISEATSFLAREQLNSFALDTIINKPFTGEYGAYLDIYGMGNYAHNILSAWADFGLLGFIVFFGTSFYLLVFSVIGLIKSDIVTDSFKLLFLFSLSLFIGYLFAKDYSYMFLGFSLGFYINATTLKNNEII
jgi:hypothetical protein